MIIVEPPETQMQVEYHPGLTERFLAASGLAYEAGPPEQAEDMGPQPVLVPGQERQSRIELSGFVGADTQLPQLGGEPIRTLPFLVRTLSGLFGTLTIR